MACWRRAPSSGLASCRSCRAAPIRQLPKLFAGYALVDGALMLYAAYAVRRTRSAARARPLAFESVVSIAAAILAVALPPVAWLRIIGGVRALVVGASNVVWSRHNPTNTLPELGGIVSIAPSILILAWPGPGLVALPWLLGLVALLSGGLLVAGSLSQWRSARLVEASP